MTLNPLLLVAAAGAAGFAVKKLTEKPAFQVSSTTTSNGTPIKIAVPVPKSVNKAQSTGVVSTAPTPPGKKTATVSVPNRGQVFTPPKSMQPDASGNPQPTAIVISPTGSSSVSVGSLKDVQRSLNTLGITPLLKEDGILGPATITNVKTFQSKSGLVVDGNAGPATKAALSAAMAKFASGADPLVNHPAVTYATVNEGPRNPAVANPAAPAAALKMTNVEVQKNLNALGAKPPLATDGKLGPMSVAAIKAFQTTHGLAADGVVGPKTKTALYLAVQH